MGNIIDLNNFRITKEKIGTLIHDGLYYEAISNGLKILNSSDYELIRNEEKGVLYFKLAYAYKMIDNYTKSIIYLDKAMHYCYRTGNKDHYYRSLWLKNNCEIKLGIGDRSTIINNFVEIKLYYESIGKDITANIVAFTMEHYNKSAMGMMFYYKSVIDKRKIDVDVEPNYNIYNTVLDMIEEIREIDEGICEEAETYLKLNILECACI